MSRFRLVWLPPRMVELADAARRLGAYAFVLRVILVAAVVMCWAVAGTIGEFDPTATLALLAFTTMAALSPDGPAPLALIVTMAGVWVVEVDPVSFGGCIVLALCALVVHVAAARAATTVKGSGLDVIAVRAWLRRTGLVAMATVVLWLVVLRLSASPGPDAVLVGVLALLGVAAVAILLTSKTLAPAEEDASSAYDADERPGASAQSS